MMDFNPADEAKCKDLIGVALERYRPIFEEHGLQDVAFSSGYGGNGRGEIKRAEVTCVITRKGNAAFIKKLQHLGWSVRYRKSQKPGAWGRVHMQYSDYSMEAHLTSPNLWRDAE